MSTPYYDHAGITIYHGDCRDILPRLPEVDLVLTDPPYGIDQEVFRATLPSTKGTVLVDEIAGDNDCLLAEWLISQINETPAVIWGANNWPHLLPHKGSWYCWDKRCDERADKMLGSPFELAWANRRTGFHVMIRVQHGGVVNSDHKRFGRSHPTQKPTKLMAEIVKRYKSAQTIADPFMGSGTTLRAAKDLGRKAIGIEIEEKYCEIAAKRLEQEVLPFNE